MVVLYSDALRRQDLLSRAVFLLGGKVDILKQARKLGINSELKSEGLLPLPADEDAPMVDFLIGS